MTGRSPGQSSAPVSPGSRLRMRKNESRSSSENQYEFATLRKSGRQDLNLRPLGPESDSARSDGLVSGGTEAQALDIIGIVDRADPPNGMDATPEERPFVPPVSPRWVELPEHLLTVREVAEHLRVCPATIYKLCAAGELVHVRISNAIRVAPADLAHFMAVHRAE